MPGAGATGYTVSGVMCDGTVLADSAGGRNDDKEGAIVTVNPLFQIDDERFDVALDIGLSGAIDHLATLEPSLDAPYLTVSIDWRPEGQRPEMRPGRRVFDDQTQQLLAQYDAHTPAHDSLSADVTRIGEWLGAVDESAHGIVVVACNAKGVFEPFALGLPVENELLTGPLPSLRTLMRIADDYGLYAVILADQQEVRLTMIQQGIARRQTTMSGSDWPRHQQQGGWSQRRYQNAAQQRIANFAKEVGEEIRADLNRARVRQVVLAAAEPMASALEEALHESVRQRIVGRIGLDMEATPADVVEATAPIAEDAERKRERAAVQMVEDNRGQGNRAVVGADEVLTALQAGQVMTLVMNEDFHADGWADFGMPLYGTGEPPKQHPAGGDASAIVPVALGDVLLRLTLGLDADVELIQTDVPVDEDTEVREPGSPFPRTEAARVLDATGGVAALLRYAVSEEESAPEG